MLSIETVNEGLFIDARDLAERMKSKAAQTHSLASAKEEALREVARTRADVAAKIAALEAEINECSDVDKLAQLTCMLSDLRGFACATLSASMHYMQTEAADHSAIDQLCEMLRVLLRVYKHETE